MYNTPITEQWQEPLYTWLAWLSAAGEGAGTVKLRKSQISRLARSFPNLSPWQVTLEELTLWIGGKGWSGSTLRSHRAAISGFYKWARATGRIDKNPAKGLPSAKSQRGKPRPASERVIDEAKLAADERDTLMIRLGAELGMRACEIAVAQASDIFEDLMGHSLIIHGKGGKIRYAHLSESMLAAIRACGSGYFFPGRIDGHLSAAYVSKRLSWALGPSTVGHQLRHRFGTKSYVDGGANLRAVQEAMGHASPETTAIYVEVPDEALRAVFMAAAS